MGPGEQVKAASPDRIRIFLCGDVMTGRGVDQILAHPSDPRLYERWIPSAEDYVRLAERRNGPIQRPVDASYVWGDALEEWRRAAPDVRIANLETSITRSQSHVPKGINYRMSPANVGCLTVAGFSCCVLSNNHVLDWGPAGLLETLDTLRREGLATAGAGRDLAEARRPAVVDLGAKGRVLVIGLGAPSSGIPPEWAAGPARPGVNLVDLTTATAEAVATELAAVRRPGDLVVASLHWGANWGYQISEGERRFAHVLIDVAGVDLVHGHSSHHAKAMEIHKGRLILYGCGDFLNDYEGIEGYDQFRGDLAVMYFADLDPRDGTLLTLEMVPLQVRRFQLKHASSEDVAWLQEVLGREAGRFDGFISRSGDRLVMARQGHCPS